MNGSTQTANGHGSTQTANGRSGTPTDALSSGQTLSLEFASAYPVGSLATTKPRASLAALDAIRTLALTIDSLAGDASTRSIAFLSAVPGEGRSLLAELSSVAFSELRPPVRLLDADPFQHAVEIGHHRRHRFRKAARRGVKLDDEQRSPESISANGDVPAFARIPVAREAYPGRSAFLRDIRSALDVTAAMRAQVLVDAPACSLSSISFSIAQMVDAVIYVVRPNWASLETHREVLTQLTLLKVNVLGIVLNEG